MRYAGVYAVLLGFGMTAAALAATVARGSSLPGQVTDSRPALGVPAGGGDVLPGRVVIPELTRLPVERPYRNIALALDGRGWVSLPRDVIERVRAHTGPVTIETRMRWRDFRAWSRAWDFGADTGAVFVGNTGTESTLVACFTGVKNDNVFACSLPLDEWVTIAAVWDEDVFRLYVDGKQICSRAAKPSAFPSSWSGYYLGNSNWRIDALFFGDIDAFSIKKGALYSRDYEPKPLIPDDRSILFYGFESVKGALVMDTSGHGNHAQLFGAWRFTVAGGLPIGGAVYVKNPDQERIRL